MDGRPAATGTTLLGAVELRVENRRRIGARRLFLKVKVGADIEHLEQGWPPVPERLVILFVKIPIDEAVTLLAEYIGHLHGLSLIHISEPTRRTPISYAVFCL